MPPAAAVSARPRAHGPGRPLAARRGARRRGRGPHGVRGRRRADPTAFAAAAARLCVSRSRERAQTGWSAGPVALSFPVRGNGAAVRLGAAPDTLLERLVAGIARLDSGGEAAALFRLLLLSQLASS